MAFGDKGAITLYGKKPVLYRLLGEHLASEYSVRTQGRGRVVNEWSPRPARPDNHWLDCLVGAAVAVSTLGATLLGTNQPIGGQRRRRRRISYGTW